MSNKLRNIKELKIEFPNCIFLSTNWNGSDILFFN